MIFLLGLALSAIIQIGIFLLFGGVVCMVCELRGKERRSCLLSFLLLGIGVYGLTLPFLILVLNMRGVP